MEKAIRGAEADLTGETLHTEFHFELKLKHHGMQITWKQANRSIRHFLYKRKNVLSAAILFEGNNGTDRVVNGWHAELLSDDGTKVLKKYDGQI